VTLRVIRARSNRVAFIGELFFGAAITFVAINAYGAAQSCEYMPIVGGGFFHRSP
jgi:hypothetical protein